MAFVDTTFSIPHRGRETVWRESLTASFKNNVSISQNDLERRFPLITEPRYIIQFDNIVINCIEDRDYVLDFYNSVGGQLDTFRYKSAVDYQLQPYDTSTPVEGVVSTFNYGKLVNITGEVWKPVKVWELYREFNGTEYSVKTYKSIKHLDVATIKVWIDNIETTFTYDAVSNEFTLPTIDPSTDVRLEGEFFLEVRFDQPSLEWQKIGFDAYQFPNVSLKEEVGTNISGLYTEADMTTLSEFLAFSFPKQPVASHATTYTTFIEDSSSEREFRTNHQVDSHDNIVFEPNNYNQKDFKHIWTWFMVCKGRLLGLSTYSTNGIDFNFIFSPELTFFEQLIIETQCDMNYEVIYQEYNAAGELGISIRSAPFPGGVKNLFIETEFFYIDGFAVKQVDRVERVGLDYYNPVPTNNNPPDGDRRITIKVITNNDAELDLITSLDGVSEFGCKIIGTTRELGELGETFSLKAGATYPPNFPPGSAGTPSGALLPTGVFEPLISITLGIRPIETSPPPFQTFTLPNPFVVQDFNDLYVHPDGEGAFYGQYSAFIDVSLGNGQPNYLAFDADGWGLRGYFESSNPEPPNCITDWEQYLEATGGVPPENGTARSTRLDIDTLTSTLIRSQVDPAYEVSAFGLKLLGGVGSL